MTALEDWNSKFGGDEDYSKATKQSGGFDFENDITYQVRVRSAKLSMSSRKDRQITLSLDILDPNQEPVGQHTMWLTLPKQPETDCKFDAEKVRKWTYRRRDDLARILGNVNRPLFALYSRKEMDGTTPTYFDRDDNRMSKAALDDRQVEINKAVMAWVDQLHEDIEEGHLHDLEDFAGVEFYIVRAENKRSPQYPYTNVYGSPSPKKAMWGGPSQAA